MKYIICLGDGMADEPLAALDNKTPLDYAKTPCMDELCRKGELGMAATIPEGMKPGSDTANLAVLGYNPRIYYSGRSPLEALSIGVAMKEEDIAIRCNIVTVSEEDVPFEERTIIDHSSDEISTKDAAVLLEAVRREMENETYQFYVGTSYRHCLIWNGGQVVELTPPHDVLEQVIGQYLPSEKALADMMRRSYDILENHPINIERRKQGLRPANCLWFWGAGTKPKLTDFSQKTGKRGMMISAVDLLKGLAVGTGMAVAEVEGANGGLNTNYEGKAQAAIQALTEDDYDFVYIHLEAPDEMGHQGSVERKVKAIEYLDGRIVEPLVKTLEQKGIDFRILVLPDHPTPIRVRTHTADPVPYLLYDSTAPQEHDWTYCEREAVLTGIFVDEGYSLIERLMQY